MTPTNKIVAPYGLWPSPITPELLSASTVSLHEVLVHPASGAVYWIESRPREGGRYTIMEYSESGSREVLPAQYSAHATVQELGGGSFTVDSAGKIIFADAFTQNVYELDPQSRETTLILKAEPLTRYAEFAIHPVQSKWVVAVKEDHRTATPFTQADDVHNTLVLIDRLTQTEKTIAVGDDFYAYPRFSPDGRQICWIQWSHPDMPWTGTTLYIGGWVDGSVENVTQIAGKHQQESVSQPRWVPDGNLLFASDKSGYWQFYLYSIVDKSTTPKIARGFEDYEFAIADWRMAASTYAILDSHTIVASGVKHATSSIVLIDMDTGSTQDLGLPFVDLVMHGTGVFRLSDDSVVILGSTQVAPKELVLVSSVRSKQPQPKTLKSTVRDPISQEFVSQARHLEVPRSTRDGNVHIFFFGPKHAEYEAPSGALPPGLIQLHGGPNGCTSPALDLAIQFWTTRGFAVCAVNYSGSIGFGRQYREELTGHWGLYDVQDTHDVVQYLVEQRLVDGARLGVYGGSAGGYGTLCAIHTYPNEFAAAVSSYGICDIQALQADSYKFESHDVERLILSSCDRSDPESRPKRYKERSPRFFVDRITAPLLLLQGSVDNAVPPEQAYMMAEEMRRHDRTVKVVEFAGEGHGWLKEDTILRAYKEQEAWWKRYLCGSTTEAV